jgi:hypothetical protein
MKLLNASLASVAVLASGCASNQLTQSGHLADYRKLKSSGDPAVQLYVSDRFDERSYGRVEFEAPTIRGKTQRLDELTPDVRQSLLDHLSQTLKERVAVLPRHQGNRSVLIRAAITDVDLPNRLLNVLTTFAIGPVSTGGATLEISATDTQTNEEVLAMVCSEKASIASLSGFTNAYTALGHAKAAINDCLSKFEKSFERSKR